MNSNKFSVLFKKTLWIIILFSSFNVFAQNWTGNVNSDWNNSANWTGWPLGGDDILIDPVNYTGAAASPVISVNSVFSPGGVIMQNGAELTILANLTTTDRVELFGAGTLMTISSGTVHAAGGGSNGRFIVSDGANVTMNNGQLIANQRVIVELGGVFILNNGTVNPGQELAIGDGNVAGSSLFDMNGGAVTIGGGIGFENEAGTYNPTFDMSAGTLTVNGDISWLGVAPGAGTPKFIMTGGSATVTGDIFNDPSSTVFLYMNISGNASLAYSGAAITLVHAADTIQQNGSSLFTLTNTNTLSNEGVYIANSGTTTFNGNTSLQGNGSYQFNHVIINAARTLAHVSPALINVKGDLMNNGTFQPNLNTIAFTGSTDQSINGGTITSFYNLTLNNTSIAGLSLFQSITVTNALQLDMGKLNSSLTHIITLTDNATSNAGSALSYINGPLKKTGNDAFVFPIGKNNKWRRLAITAPAAITSEFTGEYFDSTYTNISPVNPPLTAVTNIEHWLLSRTGSTSNVAVSLYWEDAAASAITDCGELGIGHWDGAAWNNLLATTTGVCTGSGNGFIQTNSPVNNYGIFTFGFYGNVTTQNLSICNGDSIQVGTNTYQTSGTYIDVFTGADLSDSTVITSLYVMPAIINNQVMEVCNGDSVTIGTNTYTISGIYTDTLTSVMGCDSIVNLALTILAPVNISVTQTSITLTADNATADSYQWINCNGWSPLSGATNQAYTATSNGDYAVIVVDNGCTDTSACYTINTVGIAENEGADHVNVYPNPGNGIITLQLYTEEDVLLYLSDASGRVIMTKKINSGNSLIDYSSQPDGIYFLEVVRKNSVSRKKLIKYTGE